MRKLILLVAVVLIAMPAVTRAGIDSGDIPGVSTWYFHMDFKEMRDSKAGVHLHDWLDQEAFSEIRDEVGVDLGKEVDRLTAFDGGEKGPVVVFEGPITQESKDKLMAAAATSGELQTLKSGGKVFHFFQGDEKDRDEDRSRNIDVRDESFDDGAYFSFAIRNKIILTPSREQMEAMLANGGKIKRDGKHRNALLVLSAERDLLQAGAKADEIPGRGGDWNSKILQNTKQIALLIADVDNKIAISAQLEATAPEMAESLASIARGLISLAAFSDDLEPHVAEMLQGTNVGVEQNSLTISLAMDPNAFVTMLDD